MVQILLHSLAYFWLLVDGGVQSSAEPNSGAYCALLYTPSAALCCFKLIWFSLGSVRECGSTLGIHTSTSTSIL